MSWTERDGPPVSAPKRRGFGTIVMEAMTARSVDGAVDLDYMPSGVTWRLTCPAANALEPSEREQNSDERENRTEGATGKVKVRTKLEARGWHATHSQLPTGPFLKSEVPAHSRFMSTRIAYGARLVGGILFDWWIGLSRTPDKISAETFALARKFRGRECGQHDELARPDDDGAPGQAAPRRRRGGGTGLRQHLAGLPYGPGVARARIRAVAEPAFPHHVGSGVASVEGLWQSDLPFSISSTSCFPSTIAGHIGDLDGKNGSYFTPRVTLISMANALSSAA